MTAINISYFKLDQDTNIIDYNDNFANLFNLHNNALKYQSFSSVFDIEEQHAPNILLTMQSGEQKSLILFCNSKIKIQKNTGAMLILYALVNKQDKHYQVRMVNWLNWLHSIARSLEHGYCLMSKFNDTVNKTKFSKISDASCYKALYPLITYIPQKSSSGVSQISLFEIMRVFVKQREDDKYTRDYARNVYSRIRTNLKQEYNLESTDVIDLIKDNSLLKIKFNGEIYIPHTLLIKGLILLTDHDSLLLVIINALHPVA